MLKDLFTALKRILLLEERIRAVSERQRVDQATLYDVQTRLIRVEAYLEVMAAVQRGDDPRTVLTDRSEPKEDQ